MDVECIRYWAVFRLTRWKAPTPPACHLARSGRNPDVRLLAGRLPNSENCHRPMDADSRRLPAWVPPTADDRSADRSSAVGVSGEARH